MVRKGIVLVAALLTAGLTGVWAQTGGTVAQGDNFAEKMDWLEVYARSDGSYIVEVRANENIGHDLDYKGKSNITITLRGIGANRTISGSLNVGSGVTLVLDNNITIRGGISVGGTLVMNGGSTITGNTRGPGVQVEGHFTMNGGTISGNRGGVEVSGTFTMSGGNISGNTSSRAGGGVWVIQGGYFEMSGGTISGNTAGEYGGGVHVGMWTGSFKMSGGTISGNTALENGGGVYVYEEGAFAKTGGTITGYASDRSNGNAVKNASGAVRNFRGHAVYAPGPEIREETVGPGDNLSYGSIRSRDYNYDGK